MRCTPYMAIRNGVFYYQRRLPKAVSLLWKHKMLRISLKSKKQDKARFLAAKMNVLVDNLFQRMELYYSYNAKLCYIQYKEAVSIFRKAANMINLNEKEADVIIARYLMAGENYTDVKIADVKIADVVANFLSGKYPGKTREALCQELEVNGSKEIRRIFEAAKDIDIGRCAAWYAAVDVPANCIMPAELQNRILPLRNELMLRDALDVDCYSRRCMPVDHGQARLSEKHRWQAVFEKQKTAFIAAGKRPAVIEANYVQCQIIFALAGTEFVEDFTAKKCNEIKNELLNLPLRYRYKDIKHLLTSIESNKLKKGKTVSVKTCENYISAVKTLFKVAVEEGILTSNPWAGVGYEKNRLVRKQQNEDRYRSFTSKELEAIFSPEHFKLPQKKKVSNFFVPIIGFTTGMRLNEICQLTTEDITINEEAGCYVVTVKEDGDKRAKNASSERMIPLPPILGRVGFFDYVKSVKNAHKGKDVQLFPDLTKDCRGYYSRGMTRRFATYLERLGIKSKQKVFHSFRHGYRERIVAFPTEIKNALGGWSPDTVGESYANNICVKQLYEYVKKIKFEELDPLMQALKERRKR